MKALLIEQEQNIAQLLDRYDCQLMFHEIRTCFMGAIACPIPDINPMQMVNNIWGGQLPQFANITDANTFFDALINQLWNSLTEHQEPKNPFELTKWQYKATKKDLAALAEVRTDEIAIFIEAIEGPDEDVRLPRRAVQAVRVLEEIYGFLSGIELMSVDNSIPKSKSEVAELLMQMEQMTAIAELEINEAIIACHKKRMNLLKRKPNIKRPLH